MTTPPDRSAPKRMNRELSWLSFNQRVLAQGEDPGVPLFERLRFLSIFHRNLDEFFMVRMPLLLERAESPEAKPNDRTLPEEILRRIGTLYRRCSGALADLEDALARHGIVRLRLPQLSPRELASARRHFEDRLAPALLPRTLGPRAPLPEGSGRTLYVGLLVRRGGRRETVLLSCPAKPGIFVLSEDPFRFVLEEELLLAFAHTLLPPEATVEGRGMIALTRSARAPLPSQPDFARSVDSMLRGRARTRVIRVEASEGAPAGLVKRVCEAANAPLSGVLQRVTPMSLGYIRALSAAPDDLLAPVRYPSFCPGKRPSRHMAERIFNKDLLLCYPYESMEPFLCLLEQAANDPRVQAVRITLYRVGDHPRIADALMQAARNGKEVTVVLELQARFDERNNLLLSARLMEAGCTLLYGMEEGKVHAKVCQIVYRSANGPNRIITQFGTGNYNPATARQYTDYCLMTADPELGREAAAWFRRVAVGGPTGRYRRLLASPDGMADALLRRIQGQVDRAQRGLPCGIFLKVNALSDRAIVRGLLRASRAGVPVRLLVRGICRLIPGPEDGPLEIRGIVGRFLEHSRVYCFGKGRESEVFLSSADLMPRNLRRRAELACPVLDARLKSRITRQMELYWRDTVKARVLGSDGEYHLLASHPGQGMDAQEELLRRMGEKG